MEAIESELEACRNEAATLGKLIQQRNAFFLQREQELSDAISNVASRIRIMESTAPVSQEDIEKVGGDGAVRLANLAEKAADYAVQLRKKREDESLAATAVGRLNEYLTKLQSAIVVPEQVLRSNYRNVSKFRENIVNRGHEFGADLTPDLSNQESLLEVAMNKQRQQQQRGENNNNNPEDVEEVNNNNNNDENAIDSGSSAQRKRATTTTGDSLHRSAQALSDCIHSTIHILNQESTYSHEYINTLEADLRKMKTDSHEQQHALDEARSVLESTDNVFKTVTAEKEAKLSAIRQLQEQLKKERLQLQSAVAAASEPTRSTSELAAENAKLQRRSEVLQREIAETETVCNASQQRCDIATDALLHIKEAVQRGLEAKNAALRKKTEMERVIRDLQDGVSKADAEIKSIYQNCDTAVSDAKHLRDSIEASTEEKDKLQEEEKKVHRQLARAEYEGTMLQEQEEDLQKRIQGEKTRSEQFISQQRHANLERAKLEQEVQLKNESVSSLKNQLTYLRGLLPASHPLKIL